MEEVDYPKSWKEGEGPVQGEEDTASPPKWEDQNFMPPIYITLARIYDLLAVIALKFDAKGAEKILNLHEQGHLMGDPPSLSLEEE